MKRHSDFTLMGWTKKLSEYVRMAEHMEEDQRSLLCLPLGASRDSDGMDAAMMIAVWDMACELTGKDLTLTEFSELVNGFLTKCATEEVDGRSEAGDGNG